MEGVNTKRIMKAITKLAGQAATEVQDEDRQRQVAQIQPLRAQPPSMQLYWSNTSTTTTAATNTYGTLGPSTTSGSPNVPQACQNIYVGGGGGAGTPMHTGYAQTVKQPYPPLISFTDEQMNLFMEKLAHLLSKGWECLRCHRIWNPRETGCEFCNFIDRLEGKDVERDTAA